MRLVEERDKIEGSDGERKGWRRTISRVWYTFYYEICDYYFKFSEPNIKFNNREIGRCFRFFAYKTTVKIIAASFSVNWLIDLRLQHITHSRDRVCTCTVSFRRLYGIKQSSSTSGNRQTATPAGLRIVNSSVCPGSWAHYCIITKHKHTHTLTKGYTLHTQAVCGL